MILLNECIVSDMCFVSFRGSTSTLLPPWDGWLYGPHPEEKADVEGSHQPHSTFRCGSKCLTKDGE